MTAAVPPKEPRKGLVEDALVLAVASARPGRVAVCRRNGTGAPLTVVLRATSQDGRALEVSYQRGDEAIRYTLTLVPVPQHFGGVRWLLGCPLLAPDRTPCTRRVRTLYLPPGRRYFGCPSCHRLEYLSRRQPVVYRLQRLAETLGHFEYALGTDDPLVQATAITAARETVRSFLASIERS